MNFFDRRKSVAGKGGSLFLDDISSIVASAAHLFLLGLLLEINYYFWFIQAIIDVLRNCKKRYVFYAVRIISVLSIMILRVIIIS